MKMKYSQDYIKMIQPSAMHEFMVNAMFSGRFGTRIIENRYRADTEQDAVSMHLTAHPRKAGESINSVIVWPPKPKK